MPPLEGDLGEPFQRIGADEARAMIERGNVQVVDVRQPDEYATGRVPGSVLIPLDVLIERADELRRDEDLIFVCAVGERSAVAAETAAAVGCTRIYNLEGGIVDWVRRGYPVEK